MSVVRDRVPAKTPALALRLDPKRRREKQRRRVHDLEQTVGEFAGLPVGPLEVFDRQDERTGPAQRARPCAVRAANPVGALLGRQLAQADIGLVADREERGKERQRLRGSRPG